MGGDGGAASMSSVCPRLAGTYREPADSAPHAEAPASSCHLTLLLLLQTSCRSLWSARPTEQQRQHCTAGQGSVAALLSGSSGSRRAPAGRRLGSVHLSNVVKTAFQFLRIDQVIILLVLQSCVCAMAPGCGCGCAQLFGCSPMAGSAMAVRQCRRYVYCLARCRFFEHATLSTAPCTLAQT